MSTFDVHFHSTASDGASDLATVAARVAGRPDLGLVALTDHDEIGASVALAECEPRAWVGAELTAFEDGAAVEILGLRLDPEAPALTAYLRLRRTEREARHAAWSLRLRELGLVFAPALTSANLTKAHVLDELLRHPANLARFTDERLLRAGEDDMAQRRRVSGRYLAPGGRADISALVPTTATDAAGLIGIIQAAGGLAILAHPIWRPYKAGFTAAADDTLRRWIGAGLDGLEVWHPDHDEAVRAALLERAAAAGLLITAGSDDHAAGLPALGTALPSGEQAEAALAALLAD